MFVIRLPAKMVGNAMISSLRTTSSTAHAQMDTLAHFAKQVTEDVLHFSFRKFLI